MVFVSKLLVANSYTLLQLGKKKNLAEKEKNISFLGAKHFQIA